MAQKVLLVDDEQDFVEVLQERLENRGMTVQTSLTPQKVFDKIQHENYDAIILDLQMPEMDGLTVLQEILKVHPEMQVIILTGHATVDKGIKAMKLGALDLIEKPVDINLLIEKIKTAEANKMLILDEKMENIMKDLMINKSW
ncbi:response regulator [Bacteroidetes/Chlorobi group bacterium ChocPot_Mid]|jgi:DNA-binding NtrC family response regulator|nr:MAG: response regulator [Bacteroidetes/Chlorobi group bacterium ChocPot_Mid]